MSVCALVGAVDFNADHFKQQAFDRIIAVDAGYGHLANIGVIPDVVIGDFDSLGSVPEHPQVKQFPAHKDQSDIEIALYDAFEDGYETLVVYGCLGGRQDFTYAVLQLVTRFAEAGCQMFLVGTDTVVTGLSGRGYRKLSFRSGAEGTLSLFAASEQVFGVDEIGLEYPLDKATLRNDTPIGVSNAFQAAPAHVSVEKGTALLFFPVGAWNFIDSFER